VQQVLQFAHVAGSGALQLLQHLRRQLRRGMPDSCAMRASSASHSAGRSSRRSRSGGTRISITLRR
jgi:hypothetical protein